MIPDDLAIDLMLMSECGTTLSEVLADAVAGKISPLVQRLLTIELNEPTSDAHHNEAGIIMGIIRLTPYHYQLRDHGVTHELVTAAAYRFRVSRASTIKIKLVELTPFN